MKDQDAYEQLMSHLSQLSMSYSPREALLQILKENFSPEDAKVVLALPNKVIPLQGVKISEISKNVDISLDELEKILANLSARGLIYSCKSEKDGEILECFDINGVASVSLQFGEIDILHLCYITNEDDDELDEHF